MSDPTVHAAAVTAFHRCLASQGAGTHSNKMTSTSDVSYPTCPECERIAVSQTVNAVRAGATPTRRTRTCEARDTHRRPRHASNHGGSAMLDEPLQRPRLHTISSRPKPGCVWPTVMNCLKAPADAPNACHTSSKKSPSRGKCQRKRSRRRRTNRPRRPRRWCGRFPAASSVEPDRRSRVSVSMVKSIESLFPLRPAARRKSDARARRAGASDCSVVGDLDLGPERAAPPEEVLLRADDLPGRASTSTGSSVLCWPVATARCPPWIRTSMNR